MCPAYSDMPRGGHIVTPEKPVLLADDVAVFSRSRGSIRYSVQAYLPNRALVSVNVAAQRFLDVALTTADRTWQALAWRANARVAKAKLDLTRAKQCLARALVTMEGFEVPPR
jgi:hypothetical protein